MHSQKNSFFLMLTQREKPQDITDTSASSHPTRQIKVMELEHLATVQL